MNIVKLKKNILTYKNNLNINVNVNKSALQTILEAPSEQVLEASSEQVLETPKPVISSNIKTQILKNNILLKSIKKNNIDKNENNINDKNENNTIDDYYSHINNFSNIYKNNMSQILSNPKIEFRYLCYKHIEDIRKLTLPEIRLNNKYEAVLIEYRCFPHIEFLIRNMIHKLGSEWSHTIVCGTLNYNYISGLCNNIDKNIKVIRTRFDNLMPPYQYSEYLATEEFWKMFVGEKILLYQEDSIIFGTNINDFINYDYVGAPWRKNCGLNTYDVGNGGFSLRTKQIMIDVINKYPYNTRNKLFEDVYFTKTMIEHNIGKVAKWEIATFFSSELIYNPASLGGHAFWLSNKNWKTLVYDKIINKIKQNK